MVECEDSDSFELTSKIVKLQLIAIRKYKEENKTLRAKVLELETKVRSLQDVAGRGVDRKQDTTHDLLQRCGNDLITHGRFPLSILEQHPAEGSDSGGTATGSAWVPSVWLDLRLGDAVLVRPQLCVQARVCSTFVVLCKSRQTFGSRRHSKENKIKLQRLGISCPTRAIQKLPCLSYPPQTLRDQTAKASTQVNPILSEVVIKAMNSRVRQNNSPYIGCELRLLSLTCLIVSLSTPIVGHRRVSLQLYLRWAT